MSNIQLKELARQAQNKYNREWRKKNPEKARRIQENYWLRKAEKLLQEQKEQK